MKNFVTNEYELTEDVMSALTTKDNPDEPFDMSLRFIKPSKRFYSRLMNLWFKYIIDINSTTRDQWIESYTALIKRDFEKMGDWDETFSKPIAAFVTMVVTEYANVLDQSQEDDMLSVATSTVDGSPS